MYLSLRLGDKEDLNWAQEIVTHHHYLHQRVDNRARPIAYIVSYADTDLGLIMAGLPHPTRCQGWFGYAGLPTQWQVLDLNRIWLNPALQSGGELARTGKVPGFFDRHGIWRPTVASWAIGEVLKRIQRDWVSLWPPVYPGEPYHVRLVISYSDPAYHRGALYRAMGWLPMYTGNDGQPRPGSKGKFGWCWPLPEPAWTWQDIRIARPRTMRLVGV